MLTNKKSNWMVSAFMVTITIAAHHSATGQQATNRRSTGGPLVPLPDNQNVLLAGHVHLLAKTVDQAINDLQNAELRAFARSYKRMVDAYGQLADHIGDASESIGEARTRARLAKLSLQQVSSMSTSDPRQRQALNEDVGQIRILLIGKLGSLRAQLDHAADGAKDKLMRQIHGIVVRIQQLDQLRGSLTANSRPLLPGLAESDLHQQLDSVEQSLEEEEKMLAVVSQSVKLLVDSTTREMSRTMSLLEISTVTPEDTLAELEETRKMIHSVLNRITAAYQQGMDGAVEFLTGGAATAPPSDPDALLKRVDELLRKNEQPDKE